MINASDHIPDSKGGKGISVIIPCYNDGAYLPDAVHSVIEQHLDIPFEIIIADDASPDKRTHVILSQMEALDRVRIIRREKNGGTAATRNTAVEAARYPYIFALDADDKLSTHSNLLKDGGYLGRGVEMLHADSDMTFVYARHQRFENVGHPYVFLPRLDERGVVLSFTGPHLIFRRDEALKMGGYNTHISYAEDTDFSIALLNSRIKQGQSAHFHRFEEPYILYRIRANHSSKTDNNKIPKRLEMSEMIKRSPEIFAKHFPGLEGDELLHTVLHEQNRFRMAKRIKFAKDCLAHPFRTCVEGAPIYIADKAIWKLRQIWHNVTSPATKSASPELAVHNDLDF